MATRLAACRTRGVFGRTMCGLLFIFCIWTSGPAEGWGETRGIKVLAKPKKGEARHVTLYDYTAALIIGIDRYANLGAHHQLSYAVKDARGVEALMRESYAFKEIVTLYNEKATRENIMATLYGFQTLSPDAGLFIYYAGHGITISGAMAGKDLGYLIPHDGSLEQTEMFKNLSMQQIKADICTTIPAKHIYFVFDACFAGLMLDTRATMVRPSRDLAYLEAITSEQVRQVLTAGEKGQTVLDGGPKGHSVFTGRFIENLQGVEDYITARELGQTLKKQVYADAAARGKEQRPVDGEIYGTGDFVFIPDLTKRGRKLDIDVAELEAQVARLKRLQDEAASARDEAKRRELEREQLLKEAALKQAELLKKRQEEALRRQEQAEQDAQRLEKKRKKEKEEKQQRLEKLRLQAETMRKELGAELTGGVTIESVVSELKRIKEQRDKIPRDFSAEIQKEVTALNKFYGEKIQRIEKVEPWDKEFEIKEDFEARVGAAKRKAQPLRDEQAQKVDSARKEMEEARDRQIIPLEEQMNVLSKKRFTVSVPPGSLKFISYNLKNQEMKGKITLGEESEGLLFGVRMPPKKAKEYKSNPELLVPEVILRPTCTGKKTEMVILHGPGENETYKGAIAVWVRPWTDLRVTASSSWSSQYMPENIKTESGKPWHDKGHGKNQFLVFDMGNVKTVHKFRVKMNQGWDHSAFKDFRFEYGISTNGPWKIAMKGQGIDQDCCDFQEFAFPSAVSARYWRLYMVNNWGYGWLSIQYIEFFLSN